MLLCRVADSLFWMSRYIERAENTARIVDVNVQLLLETDGTSRGAARHWEAILKSLGDWTLFQSLYPEVTTRSVMEFMTFARDNPSSIISCVYAARENARMIRDQIAEEMWEIINRCYLFIRGQQCDQVWNSGVNFFLEQVKEYTILFQGITDAIFPHSVGFEFIKCGCFLERADKTARILDTKNILELPNRDAGGVVDLAGWVAVLRSCSAREAYQRTYVQDIVPRNVAELLVLSRVFPRSIFYCMQRLQFAMHAISGCPLTHYSNEAERMTGRVLSELTYSKTDDVLRGGLHKTLGHISETIYQIALELSNCYMFFPIVDPTAGEGQTQKQET